MLARFAFGSWPDSRSFILTFVGFVRKRAIAAPENAAVTTQITANAAPNPAANAPPYAVRWPRKLFDLLQPVQYLQNIPKLVSSPIQGKVIREGIFAVL